ncbi:MAG TPA: glycosyltransferase family 2 protein [Ignavibacteria bacterium]|nr:glycosyltransferase family 2 protein [Ignavibacteria bacterium]HMR40231.1 glycosyltransferase family 2 protein [Ignavibacteria bacterium]
MLLSIIIVNYNTHEHLDKCIESIQSNLHEIDYEIIVADNNSPDRGIENLRIKFKDVKFYFLDENKGFGSGCNYAVKKSHGKYLLLVNPDIEFINNSVIKLLKFMENDKTIGACSGLLLDQNDMPAYNFNSFPDYSWELKNAYGVGVSNAIIKLLENPDITGAVKRPFEVDWFHGALLLIRRDVYDEVEGFDENIFLYYEDVDIQKKIKESGYKIFCLPEVSVRHFTQSSVRSIEGRKIYYYYMHLNKLYYMKKHFGIIKRSFIRINYIIGYIIRIILLPFRKKFKGRNKEKLEHYLIILNLYLFKYKF